MSERKLPTILLIRHGETQWNVEGRLQGGQDAPLTLNGFRQICAVAENIRDLWSDLRIAGPVNYLTSPLGRARQTASILSDCWDIGYSGFKFDSKLQERNYGTWEGMTLSEVSQSRPAEFNAYQCDPWNYPVPEGESKTQLSIRIKGWLEKLPTDQSHVVVTHSGCFRLIRGLYVGASQAEIDEYREPQTTSYLLDHGGAYECEMPLELSKRFGLNPKALTVHI
ncbi:probable phosphoglycerate mutase [Thalassospira xiamenensis M-5 = DSM 17429]|uniref:Phosphoglycerate mutase n=1 Tax=Thalassospira xiamenensis M-5 = DSM 17429 TaxID=1123366 RepID=A0AB72U7V7_9PROT|nr:histidine phosphatase family protein [Thalassospira xiamenensis]AJD50284.1 phosphoglycerate mutase [Thalassospira xiamenensis M-5 = DSM 17429]SIT32778.1 probable phosphoglycerate mutase [Thalassospira xiamenensis M-5 = DSM 17429]